MCDAGFPVPRGIQRIDFAVTANLPSLCDVLRVILDDLEVERFILAKETAEASSKRHAEILALLPGVPHDEVPHTEFKHLAREVRAVIRTGDFVPYSNILLDCGVVFA